MEKVYLVIVRKDETEKGDSYCVDDRYYCAGIYTDLKQAEKRAEDFPMIRHGELNVISNCTIKEFEVDKDLFVYKGHISEVSDEDVENANKNYLGGACYYE